MFRTILIPAISLTIALGAMASARAEATLYEEMQARQEEKLILTSPIAGVENSLWFDYRINVTEAQKELTSDLRRASDTEDVRDAWDEYGHELRHERIHYVKKMEKRGYRQGRVILGG